MGRGSGDGRPAGSAVWVFALSAAPLGGSFDEELPIDSDKDSAARSCGAEARGCGGGCESVCGGGFTLLRVSSAERLEELLVVAVALVKLAAWDGLAVALVPGNELLV